MVGLAEADSKSSIKRLTSHSLCVGDFILKTA